MLQSWRFQIRAARQAIADGRWAEAAESLTRKPLCEFLPAKRLAQELASQLVGRSESLLGQGEVQAAWRVLDWAVRLGAEQEAVLGVQRNYASAELAHAADEFAAGQTSQALARLAALAERNLGGEQRQAWTDFGADLDGAERLEKRHDWPRALERLRRAQRRLPIATPTRVGERIQQRIDALQERVDLASRQDAQLHQALAEARWSEVLHLTGQVLELMPDHSLARRARRKAWQAVGLDATRLVNAPASPPRPPASRSGAPVVQNGSQSLAAFPLSARQRPTSYAQKEVETRVASFREPGRRIVVWIDSVGGFLFCLERETSLGQPAEGWGVDVPILGDLSRRHALLRRDGEAYLVTALHPMKIDGQSVVGPTVLRQKARLELGENVAIDFRKPHPLSHTAVLTLASHHKLEPAVDGVVLMSESCVFGPRSHCHVVCRQWSSELVMFRRGEQLLCRGPSDLLCDGVPCGEETPVEDGCRLESEDFAMSFEYL